MKFNEIKRILMDFNGGSRHRDPPLKSIKIHLISLNFITVIQDHGRNHGESRHRDPLDHGAVIHPEVIITSVFFNKT